MIRQLVVLALVTVMLGCGKRSAERGSGLSDQLNVFNWSAYIADSTIANFEQEFGVKVNYDNFSSNDELLAKLQAGVSQYDVIVPADYMVKIMISQGLLAEIDSANIPNRRNIDPRFRHLPYDPAERYSVPYLWGTTGIGYNSAKISAPVKSWKILWDPLYAGRITMLDEARSGVTPAQKVLGFSVNTVDVSQLLAVKDLMIRQKPLVRAYSSSTYMDLLKSGDVWLSAGFSGDVYQVSKTNPEIKFAIPAEGTDIWFDNLCIPRNAPHHRTAEAFINYILRPEVGAAIANFTRYASPNAEARRFIRKEILTDSGIYPPPDVLEKCEFLEDVGPSTRLYDRLWSEIKSR